MKYLRIVHGLLLVVWLFFGMACTVPEEKYDFTPVKNQIEEWVVKGYYDGAGIVIGDASGILYDTCFGNYRPDDPVYVASAGKWIAAATIATVVDQGKLAWNTKASEYIQGLKGRMGDATLRQLLSHTSGYPPYQPKDRMTDKFNTLSESVDYLLPLEAQFAPGERFEYGGLAMQVAGRIAEIATGKSWDVIFQENIAGPLNMTNTAFTPVDTLPGHSPMLGGGLHTTLNDYTNFLQLFFQKGKYNGKQILSESSVNEIMKDQVGRAQVSSGEFVEKAHDVSRNDIYGLGVWREFADADSAPLLISSPGWAGAYPWIDWEHEVYGFFIAHINTLNAARDGFSSFNTAPTLAMTVRKIVYPLAM